MRRPKLSPDDAERVRTLYRDGRQSAEQIARMFKVAPTTIHNVIGGRPPYAPAPPELREDERLVYELTVRSLEWPKLTARERELTMRVVRIVWNLDPPTCDPEDRLHGRETPKHAAAPRAETPDPSQG